MSDGLNEEWREAVPDYDVSSLGRVRSWIAPGSHKRAATPHILRPTDRGNGYLCVGLHGRLESVHVLVALAFHGPKPTAKHEVAHGDGNQQNNRADNLRWATRSENFLDKRLHGTSRPPNALPESLRAAIRADYAAGRGTQYEIARRYGISQGAVSLAVRRKE